MIVSYEFTFKYSETQENLLCEVNYMDGDNYSIYLYNKEHKEIFSTWIDSSGGEVTGNQEIYIEGYDKAIDICYDFFNTIQTFLITGEDDGQC